MCDECGRGFVCHREAPELPLVTATPANIVTSQPRAEGPGWDHDQPCASQQSLSPAGLRRSSRNTARHRSLLHQVDVLSSEA